MKLLSRVQLLVTPWTAAYQAPLSMRFSRQEYWSGVPFPSPGTVLPLLLLSHFSRVRLCVTPQTAAHQAPRSLGLSRQEHWSGLPFLLQRMKVKLESEVAQSCLNLSDPMYCSLPGSSIHGIFQARVLEWGAIAFSGYCVRWFLLSLIHIDILKIGCYYFLFKEEETEAQRRQLGISCVVQVIKTLCFHCRRPGQGTKISIAVLSSQRRRQMICPQSQSACVLVTQSCPTLCDPWTVAHKAPPYT